MHGQYCIFSTALYHTPWKEVDGANILLCFSNIISVTFFVSFLFLTLLKGCKWKWNLTTNHYKDSLLALSVFHSHEKAEAIPFFFPSSDYKAARGGREFAFCLFSSLPLQPFFSLQLVSTRAPAMLSHLIPALDGAAQTWLIAIYKTLLVCPGTRLQLALHPVCQPCRDKNIRRFLCSSGQGTKCRSVKANTQCLFRAEWSKRLWNHL